MLHDGILFWFLHLWKVDRSLVKQKEFPKKVPDLSRQAKSAMLWQSKCDYLGTAPCTSSLLRSRSSACCWESQWECCLFLKWEVLLRAQDTENGCLRSSNHAIYKATAAARLCLNDMSAKAMRQTAFRNNSRQKKKKNVSGDRRGWKQDALNFWCFHSACWPKRKRSDWVFKHAVHLMNKLRPTSQHALAE